jgi:hypothetical protein
LRVQDLLEIIALVGQNFSLAACAITAYDPEYDENDKALSAALAAVRGIASQVFLLS